MLIRSRVAKPGLATRIFKSAAGLFFPEYDVVASRRNNVLAVRRRMDVIGGVLVPRINIIPASNIATNDGDYFYARAVYDESNIDTFDVMELGSAGTPAKGADRSDFTPIGSTEKALTSGYPTTDDQDADNTGAGTDVISYRSNWAANDFTAAAVSHGWITNATPGASENLLTGYVFPAPFAVTATDTLKVIVNHTMNGV